METRLDNRELIKHLLERWESRKRLGPGVRPLLQEVAGRVDSGQWHVIGWNIFEIMGICRREDSHTDILAWLFKPWEAHGLGETFLREFARRATGKSLPKGRVRGVKARGSEGCKIDVEVRGDGWVLAVENKIDWTEGPDQTLKYARHYRRLQESGLAVFGVFLTVEGTPAKAHDFFHPMSYRTLRGILTQDRMSTATEAAQVVRWFADHIRKDLEA